jgi:hypothetical protein
MGVISDEIANLVQHVKDVWNRIDHKLSDQGKAEMSKLHEQATAVLDLVKADAKDDAADVEADVREDVAAAQSPAASPSSPPAPQPTVAAGTPTPDTTGGVTSSS